MSESASQSHAAGPSLPIGEDVQPELANPFDALHGPEAIEETLDMFHVDRLLARAMDGPLRTLGGFDYGMFEDEIGLMAAGDGMQHVSTTLLIPRERVHVYKSLGFLVDSARTRVEHVAELDSGSSVSSQGELQANASDLTTLEELAGRLHDTHPADMNEVNVTLPISALRGLFVAGGAASKLDGLIIQQHLNRQGYGILPLFTYNSQVGSLTAWSPSAEEVLELLREVGLEKVRQGYATELALKIIPN